MSGSFSEGSGRLAGLAGAVLGWRPAEFWAATPAELACVLRAYVGEGEAGVSSADVERLKGMFPD